MLVYFVVPKIIAFIVLVELISRLWHAQFKMLTMSEFILAILSSKPCGNVYHNVIGIETITIVL